MTRMTNDDAGWFAFIWYSFIDKSFSDFTNHRIAVRTKANEFVCSLLCVCCVCCVGEVLRNSFLFVRFPSLDPFALRQNPQIKQYSYRSRRVSYLKTAITNNGKGRRGTGYQETKVSSYIHIQYFLVLELRTYGQWMGKGTGV